MAQENGWRTYNVSVDAPPGYSVSVSPSTLRLKKGQSATFYVTVTNETAPIGEWRFGSLTWKETTGNYSVYSPIAVRGALFEAPAEVSRDPANDWVGEFRCCLRVHRQITRRPPTGSSARTDTAATISQDPDQTLPQCRRRRGRCTDHLRDQRGGRSSLDRLVIPRRPTMSTCSCEDSSGTIWLRQAPAAGPTS